MQIEFKKIDKTIVPFKLKKDTLIFSGTLKHLKKDLLECDGTLEGTLLTSCIRCSNNFPKIINDTLRCKISDGVCVNAEDIDIIEMENGVVDLDEILQSEIESYHCEYNICENCKDIQIDYEG